MLALKVVEQPDGTLITAALGGDHSAFGILVERYQERLFRLLSRFARDRMETEDLAQEVFIKVFRKLHTFQRDSSLYTWMYRIAVNTARDHLSRGKRHSLHLVEDSEVFDSGQRDPGYAGAAEPLLEEELQRVTREVLDGLSEKYRTILILREYEDLSYTAIAEVLGCSLGTVESRLFRARKHFKEAMERMHPDLVPQARRGTR